MVYFVTDKFMRVLYIIFHVGFNLDFGYITGRSPKTVFIIKFCTVLQVIYTTALCAIFFDVDLSDIYKSWSCLEITHIVINTITLMCYGENSIYHRHKESLSIDIKLQIDTNHINFKFLTAAILIVVHKVSMFSIFCMFFENDCFLSKVAVALAVWQQIAYELVMLVCFFIFYAAYCQMKVLNNCVSKCKSEIFEYIFVYKSIVDYIFKAMKVFEYIVSIRIFIS
jgi:hypothetical protein